MQALILLGHGSHLHGDSSAPVFAHADVARGTGIFDEVRECFWKEEPSMRDVLDLVESEDVFVVPVFIARGYFTEEVIPRELGLDGPAPSCTVHGRRRVHYCAPVGTHPSMPAMILRRAEEGAGLSDEEARRAALVIVGHGTERNSTSAEVIVRVADEARKAGIFGRVEAAFLDQSPEVTEVVAGLPERTVVIVPFFISEGWHTEETLPDDLGIARPAVSRRTELGDRVVYYAAPVGTFPEIAGIVLERAREAGARWPDDG